MNAAVARQPRAARWGAAVSGLLVLVTAAMGAMAVRADLDGRQQAWLVAVDVAVGLGFLAGGVVARGPVAVRWLVMLVGLAWLAGSVWWQARSLHQAVLAVALAGFPSGKVRGRIGWVVLALCVPVGSGLLPQVGVAAVFAVVAGAGADRVSLRRATGMGYPVAAAAGLAVLLGCAWLVGPAVEPTRIAVAYQGVLLAIGLGYPFAVASVLRSRVVLADQLLGRRDLPLLDGVVSALRDALGDPSVGVHRRRDPAGAGDDGGADDDGQVAGDAHVRRLDVADDAGPVATVVCASAALDDRLTADAVASVVRLTMANLRLQEERRSRLLELEAARLRIVASADRQRRAMSEVLNRRVEPALRAARSELAAAGDAVGGCEVASVLVGLQGELSRVSASISGLVAGVPPAMLGDGRLRAAVVALAAACPVQVEITVTDDAATDRATETALFYLCSEGLANAVKHARADRIWLVVGRTEEGITVTVTDDGVGGADRFGSGLQGLADRMATRGGRLRVDSAPGAGTVLTATVPFSRSSSTV